MWHAVLEIRDFSEPLTHAGAIRGYPKGAEYCLSVHAYSNLRMEARVDQSGFTPGSTLVLRATLSEYGVPVEHRAVVRAQLEYPDHASATLSLAEIQPGVFEASLVASISGIYRFNIVAEGVTFRGTAFSREQLLTAAVSPEIVPQPGGGGEAGSGIVGGRGEPGLTFAKCCRRFSWLAAIVILLLLVIIWLLWRR
jgi:hypothetical protein